MSKPPVDGAVVIREVVRHRPDGVSDAPDQIVGEAPMEIRLGSVPLAVIMRTPGHDDDLVRGFALTEGIAMRPGEIAGVEPGPAEDGSRWILRLADGVTVDAEQFRRNLYTTSSCGVCGKASIDAVRVAAVPARPGPIIDPSTLLALPGRMRAAQTAFALTGGLHAAAVFDGSGSLLELREDVGRHNAVDKVIGAMSRVTWPLHDRALVVSGRVSFEIVQKAAVAGLGLVAGVSAPSSLAIDLADELGQTVVGFLRERGFNLYSGRHRVLMR